MSIRNHILKEFYGVYREDTFKNMIDQYGLLKGFENNSNVSIDQHWPLILIGSIAEVHDLDYNETERLKIVPPFYDKGGERFDCASCLSPVGHALLFKRVGDRITVNTPLGNCRFMVKSIELPTL